MDNPGTRQEGSFSLPEEVRYIIRMLEEKGFEAYAVGGCVRDLLLGRIPKDYDVTTDALPREIKRVFRNTVDTGIQHGTVTVVLKDGAYEVTTYRIDGVYEDGRHPKEVTFSRNLREDLARRDFTINAMAYHPDRGIVDLYGGMQDLHDGVIRCVGEPDERFGEDALRIMRALRFAAQLGFEIDGRTEESVRAHARDLKKISAERIRDEMMKLITSPNPERWRSVYEDGISAQILPEFDAAMKRKLPDSPKSAGEHAMEVMAGCGADPVLRLAALLQDLVTEEEERPADDRNHLSFSEEKCAERILRRLKFDNHTIRSVTRLVRYHAFRPKASEASVRRAAVEVGRELVPYWLALQKADAEAGEPEEKKVEKARIETVTELYDRIIERGDCLSIAELAITGEDLIGAGIAPGKEIGYILNSALMAVLEEPSLNDHDLLMLYALQIGTQKETVN